MIRTVGWILSKETAEGAPLEPLYEVDCMTCGATSGASEGDLDMIGTWPFRHVAQHPTHTGYHRRTDDFLRMSTPPRPPDPHPIPIDGTLSEEDILGRGREH